MDPTTLTEEQPNATASRGCSWTYMLRPGCVVLPPQDEEGICLAEFEARLRARLAAKKADEIVNVLENEGEASLTLRLQRLTIQQNEAFDADTASMQQAKEDFIVKVVLERESRASVMAESAEIAASHSLAETTRLEMLADENQAELDQIRDATDNLHDTVRTRIEKEMGVYGV